MACAHAQRRPGQDERICDVLPAIGRDQSIILSLSSRNLLHRRSGAIGDNDSVLLAQDVPLCLAAGTLWHGRAGTRPCRRKNKSGFKKQQFH
jgi:hypothetical protein